uniref:Frizzled-9 n=1 Tax=Hofstenia miamia TaxID=442651 RepID=A0A068CM83_HOFMI|nr:frizzled-9 [Hofstenia miamia]
MMEWLIVCILLLIHSTNCDFVSTIDKRSCELISIDICKGLGYNLTSMPNRFNHDNQLEVGLEINQFATLIKIGCSDDLRFLLCTQYLPPCFRNYNMDLTVCRPLCERAKDGCTPVMESVGFQWPQHIACEPFPEKSTKDRICMDRPNMNKTKSKSKAPKGNKIPNQTKCDCHCRERLVVMNRGNFTTGTVPHCALPCRAGYFSDETLSGFTTLWLGIWATTCFVSTTIMTATFLIDRARFKYPERPIIWLAICYLFIAIGFIIRLIAGHENVACSNNKDVINYEVDINISTCMLVFILVYYFGMASALWWVILSFTWFLAAGLKWSSEAISQYACVYHIIAWAIPALLSIFAIILKAIDGDSVSGLCYVGNQSDISLQVFVICPLIIFIFVGGAFLFAGFFALCRIRNVIKAGGRKTDQLEKLMARISIFSVLYTVPATVVIFCYLYELRYRGDWEHGLACRCRDSASTPDYAIFMLKYFMSLVVGITSGFWIWTKKTINSWQTFLMRICCCSKPKQQVNIINAMSINEPFSHVYKYN